MAALAASFYFYFTLPIAIAERARFFKSWLRRIAPHTHVDQAMRYKLPVALAGMPPQKNVGTAVRPCDSTSVRAASTMGAPIGGWLTLRAIRFDCSSGAAAQHPIQFTGLLRQWVMGACRPPPLALRKTARYIKGFLLLQDMEARTGQFVG